MKKFVYCHFYQSLKFKMRIIYEIMLQSGSDSAAPQSDNSGSSGSGSILNLVAPLVSSSSGVSLNIFYFNKLLYIIINNSSWLKMKKRIPHSILVKQSISSGSSGSGAGGSSGGTADPASSDGSSSGGSSFSSILSLLGPILGSSSGSGVSTFY